MSYIHDIDDPKDLPKNPKKGSCYKYKINAKNGPRKVTVKATGKKGFGKWKIVKNEPVKK